MTTRQPKTKAEVLNDISNEILDKYLEGVTGLCEFKERSFKKYLEQAEKNKTGSFATYHYILALIYTAQHKYESAYKKYKVALNLNAYDIPTLNNFATLLVNMNKYDEAFEVLDKLITDYNVNIESTFNNIIKISLRTLDSSYLNRFSDNKLAFIYFEDTLKVKPQLNDLRNDIQEIGILVKEYTEYLEFLSKFVLEKTNQTFYPRFSIDNGLDKQLNIEVFLDINSEEASYLDSEFRNLYLDYVFDNELHNLLGKFVVFFRQCKNRYDGTKNPDALYLGMNTELVA